MEKEYVRDYQTFMAIHEFEKAHGYAISIRQLADVLGLKSTQSAHERLTRLRSLGLVDWIPGESRTTHLTDSGKSVLTGERVFGTMREVE